VTPVGTVQLPEPEEKTTEAEPTAEAVEEPSAVPTAGEVGADKGRTPISEDIVSL
jgi:hypothetical protein